MNQHATIEEGVFSVGGRTEGLRQLELELRESPEFRFGRIMGRKDLGCRYIETVMNPLPRNG
jgi:hypothetical protein